MAVRFLAEVPGHADTLARWHHATWGHLYTDWTLDVATEELLDHATRRSIPTTLVAMRGDVLLGSVSLVLEDAPELRDQGDAWMASLYVVPEARGQGLGVRLAKELVALAAQQQVERLWLFTPEHAPFYARLGWRPQGSAKLHGVPVHLMDIVPA
ncbi:MAG: GNAT family N-acetyltransferase [Arenimonas sp.]|uniref:GNAT family N-acetyltransferase n=1 Tax=Arenimonas sp. TaxID=1872635 RepID=UPI0025C6E3EA|nr:GNAT family N-acetyltransferase [Arenimonas sp.]MBW8367128.1 GNAT family N-acetyltransferase [Arenimonas sp.]